jgi:hypothetical protein
MQLLDPLEVDHRDHADQEVDVARDVDLLSDDTAMQTLVEQQVGLAQFFPWREGARLLPKGHRLLLIVQVFAPATAPGVAVALKERLELTEQVGLGAEMAEAMVATLERFGHLAFHLGSIVAVEAVALDECGVHAFPAEDPLERTHDRSSAGARGASDTDDGMLCGHGGCSAQLWTGLVKRPRGPNSGASNSKSL